ncbi:Flp family type IVb pilin [Auraticoccus sp. F435]|uniref:Flp family type IVb pilin n=2 Tax=Auraticoccus cholistanensis TaxID=2656650 RepID=A0A6A9V163_9ACTN|nr:Flp family type IVb pilin [Auraticoccus cholistanensis]
MFVRLTIALGALTGRLDARRDRGATAVEYGLLVGLIAVGIIVAITALGDELRDLFNGIELPDGNAPAAGGTN